MSTPNEPPTSVEVSESGSPFDMGSIMDTIKRESAELAAAKDVYIPVQGYEHSGLALHYVLPESGKALSSVAEKVMREVKKDQYTMGLYIALDTIAFLARGFYVRHPDYIDGVSDPDTQWVEFDPKLSGAPIGFDETLCECVGLPTEPLPPTRQMIRKLFGNNEMMIQGHVQRLQRWLQDARTDVSEEYWDLAGNF